MKLGIWRSRIAAKITRGLDFHQTRPWQHILDLCKESDRCIPLLAVYRAVAADGAQPYRCSLNLEGSLGIDRGHRAIPEAVELHDGKEGFIPALRAAMSKGCSMPLDMPDRRLPEFLLEDVQ